MKNLIKRILVLLGVMLLTSSLTAQGNSDITTKRVSFAHGASSATIDGSITGYHIVDYMLNVRAGQSMNVSMATQHGATYFNIMEPGEEYEAVFNGSMGENQFEGTTAKSGDYRIRVYMERSAARRNEHANYHLEVIVSGSGQAKSTGDAMVAGSNFNATGSVPCSLGNGQPTTNCNFGVVRRENGSGDVHITLPDGSKRFIYFQDGKAVGYDHSAGELGEFRATKESDLYIIHIGHERYEIPEAVIYGG